MASRQACRLCRRRKVKCDGLPTCSNCHAAETPCQYLPPRKRGPKPAKCRDNHPAEPLHHVGSASPATYTASPPSPASAPAPSSPLSSRETPGTANLHPLFEPRESQTQAAARIHLDLLAGLLVAAPSETAASVASHCILLYTQLVFGALPMCHEAAVRATARRFFIPLSGGGGPSENHARILACFAADTEGEWIEALRSLTLLTALCASVAYVVPESRLSNKHLIAPLFLRAARETLQVYEDYDLDHPNSSSLGIRLFLSSAIQTATGTRGVAFHILGEAGIIAMRMRLYDESSLQGKEPVEENLLRNAFWQLYVCDKTALVMKARPVTVHEALFDTELSLKTQSRNSVTLFDHGWDSDRAAVEARLLEGFHLIRRLWAMAARVIQAMESNSKRASSGAPCRESITQLSEAYFEMVTLTNNLPTWVWPGGESPTDRVSLSAEQHLFDILQRQRTSYLISLHSIKVFVLHSAIQCNMTEVMGLSTAPLMLSMRQIELAQDFLNVLGSVPFVHLQVEGEQCVEKIRRVGSLMLELTHGAENDMVKSQANQCAMRFIDLLVRLDSKASDVLGQ